MGAVGSAEMAPSVLLPLLGPTSGAREGGCSAPRDEVEAWYPTGTSLAGAVMLGQGQGLGHM